MKRVQFVSKASAEALQGRQDTAVISINGLDPARLQNGWHSVLRLEFDDVDVAQDPYILFDTNHAVQIVVFTRECNASDVETILVHCNAGISRSAAVAKWIAERYGLPFPAGYMLYNKHVYNVLNMFGRQRYDDHGETKVISNPDILGGEPVIEGTRVPVRNVLAALRDGESRFSIFCSYPSLPLDAIEVCLEWEKSGSGG